MHNFFFGIYPYIALSVAIIGSIARYERDPFTWKSSSSQLLRRKQLIVGSVLFHVGVYRSVTAWDTGNPAPGVARLQALCSIALWVSVILCGRLLAYT